MILDEEEAAPDAAAPEEAAEAPAKKRKPKAAKEEPLPPPRTPKVRLHVRACHKACLALGTRRGTCNDSMQLLGSPDYGS